MRKASKENSVEMTSFSIAAYKKKQHQTLQRFIAEYKEKLKELLHTKKLTLKPEGEKYKIVRLSKTKKIQLKFGIHINGFNQVFKESLSPITDNHSFEFEENYISFIKKTNDFFLMLLATLKEKNKTSYSLKEINSCSLEEMEVYINKFFMHLKTLGNDNKNDITKIKGCISNITKICLKNIEDSKEEALLAVFHSSLKIVFFVDFIDRFQRIDHHLKNIKAEPENKEVISFSCSYLILLYKNLYLENLWAPAFFSFESFIGLAPTNTQLKMIFSLNPELFKNLTLYSDKNTKKNPPLVKAYPEPTQLSLIKLESIKFLFSQEKKSFLLSFIKRNLKMFSYIFKKEETLPYKLIFDLLNNATSLDYWTHSEIKQALGILLDEEITTSEFYHSYIPKILKLSPYVSSSQNNALNYLVISLIETFFKDIASGVTDNETVRNLITSLSALSHSVSILKGTSENVYHSQVPFDIFFSETYARVNIIDDSSSINCTKFDIRTFNLAMLRPVVFKKYLYFVSKQRKESFDETYNYFHKNKEIMFKYFDIALNQLTFNVSDECSYYNCTDLEKSRADLEKNYINKYLGIFHHHNDTLSSFMINNFTEISDLVYGAGNNPKKKSAFNKVFCAWLNTFATKEIELYRIETLKEKGLLTETKANEIRKTIHGKNIILEKIMKSISPGCQAHKGNFNRNEKKIDGNYTRTEKDEIKIEILLFNDIRLALCDRKLKAYYKKIQFKDISSALLEILKKINSINQNNKPILNPDLDLSRLKSNIIYCLQHLSCTVLEIKSFFEKNKNIIISLLKKEPDFLYGVLAAVFIETLNNSERNYHKFKEYLSDKKNSGELLYKLFNENKGFIFEYFSSHMDTKNHPQQLSLDGENKLKKKNSILNKEDKSSQPQKKKSSSPIASTNNIFQTSNHQKTANQTADKADKNDDKHQDDINPSSCSSSPS